jgi:CubicO group peptidase (beta-lactamase class C family)
VYESFARGFTKGELGAAVSAYVDGRKVVDLWGGWADAERTREWQRDTIACTYSATKGMTATCAHHLVDRGLLDVDQPVATYWPEFAQAGKEKITVRMVLSHQAGRPRPRSRGTSRVMGDSDIPTGKRFDWETLTTALARGAPVWEPGTRSEYHGGEFGYLVGEILRRIDGRSLARYFREEIAEPLGADFLFAVGQEDDHRCAEMVGPDDMIGASNTREYRAAADGSATSHGTADGLARV